MCQVPNVCLFGVKFGLKETTELQKGGKIRAQLVKLCGAISSFLGYTNLEILFFYLLDVKKLF